MLFQRELTKRRENKARAELAGKTDKVNILRQEIAENESQLTMAQVRVTSLSVVTKIKFNLLKHDLHNLFIMFLSVR